jgi:hypothetical protein
VAEEALGSGVPESDDPVERLADDRVLGRVDEGGEEGLGGAVEGRGVAQGRRRGGWTGRRAT